MGNVDLVELRRLYQEGRIIPFVGAGASMSVKWFREGKPQRGLSWGELVDKAADLLGVKESDLLRMRGTDLQILEYFSIKKGGIQPLINWLHYHMQPQDDDILKSKIHNQLSLLNNCSVAYTTNYDDFIERSYDLHKIPYTTISSEHDLSERLENRQLVKFHGDFNRPEAMVMKETDYEARMRLEGVMDLKLRSDVLGKALLFIGYSFRDPNVAYLFRLINDHFKELPQSFAGRRAYIIISNPSDFERQLFNARKIQVIPTFGEDLAADVARILEDMRS